MVADSMGARKAVYLMIFYTPLSRLAHPAIQSTHVQAFLAALEYYLRAVAPLLWGTMQAFAPLLWDTMQASAPLLWGTVQAFAALLRGIHCVTLCSLPR